MIYDPYYHRDYQRGSMREASQLYKELLAESRWVTQVNRLFPHPVFAAAVAAAALMVTAIFTLGAIIDGSWVFGAGAVVFAAGAVGIVAAKVSRWRRRRQLVRLEKAGLADFSIAGVAMLDNHVALAGGPPIPTRHLLLYLGTILIWETQLAAGLLRMFNVFPIAAIWWELFFGICICASLLAVKLCRDDYRRSLALGGNVELTRVQVFIVVVGGVSISVTMTILFLLLTNKF